jgi:NADH-ubiquinone oxidoreductase chain 6
MPFTFNNVPALSSLLVNLNNLNWLLLNSYHSKLNTVFISFNPTNPDTTFTNYLHIQAIGQSLYTYGAILFIILSVILLLAMVAPIFISSKKQK